MYSQLDLSKSVQKPKFFLCKPNRTTIAPLTETQDERLHLKLNGVNKLEFNIPYYVQKHNRLVKNKHIDLIKSDFLIRMVYGDLEEYFVIKKPNPNSENTDILSVQCASIEDKLRGRKIFSYKSDAVQINTISNTVLDRTGWTLGTYPTNGEYRQFNITSKTVLEVLNEIADTFDTLLHFDTVNKTVHFYSKDYFANFKGLVISEKRYLQSFLREHNDEEFCTRLYVFGKDGITINRLNPTGNPYIDDFSYYLYPFQRDSQGNVLSSSDYMSDGLCHAILDYQDLLETKKTEYQTLLDEKSVLLSDMTTLENQMETLQNEKRQIEDEIWIDQKAGLDTTTLEQDLANKQAEVDAKQTEIDNKQADIDAKNNEISTLRNQCSESNNFTQAQLDELYGSGSSEGFVKVDEFKDDNQTEDTSLYEKGLNILQEKKIPDFKIQSNIANFKEMITEQKHWDKLTLGSVVRVKKENMGQDVKSQVIEIEFDFDNKDIRIVQANTTDYIGTEKRMMKYFYLSEEAANILNSKKGEWDSTESQVTQYIDNQISDVNTSISELNKGFEKFASDGFISKDESNLMSNQQDQLNSESTDLINTADSLGITTEKTNYQNALSTLSNELSVYIGQSASDYPIAILSTDRTNITNAFDDVQNTKSILVNKINDEKDAILDQRITDEVSQLNSDISALDSYVDKVISDNVVTENESEQLDILLKQVKSESTDLLNIASNLNISTERTNYNNALSDLETELSNWIGQTGYPLDITATQRTTIQNKFEVVQDTKSILINKIASVREGNANSYTDNQIDQVNTTTNNLQSQIDDFSDDNKLTLAEANSLESTLSELQKESADIINIATNLEITTEKTNYNNALNDTTLDTNSNAKGLDPYLTNNWINQSSYPLNITSTQRSEIKSRLENVQNTKSILINKIASTREANANSYTDTQIDEVNTTTTNLQNQINDFSDDLKLTLAEANALENSLNQVNKESEDVVNVATNLGITTEKTNYENALSDLDSYLTTNWINQSGYPLSITSTDRNTVKTKFQTVQDTKSILINKIQDVRDSNLDSKLSQDISDVNTDLSNLDSRFTTAISDDVITENEAQGLKKDLKQVQNESTDIIDAANKYNITTAKTDYQNALSDLETELTTYWIDQSSSSYPIDITTTQRDTIRTKFNAVQDKKSILVNALNEARGIKISGWGIINGGSIGIENRQENLEVFTHVNGDQSDTSTSSSYLTSVTVDDTSTLPSAPSSGEFEITFKDHVRVIRVSDGSGHTLNPDNVYNLKWGSKTTTSLEDPIIVDNGYEYYPCEFFDQMAIYKFKKPIGDIVVSPFKASYENNRIVENTTETRFSSYTLGTNQGNTDGWTYVYLWIDSNGVVSIDQSDTLFGTIEYPPDPPSGSIRIGYILTGYGESSPDGTLSTDKRFSYPEGIPVFRDFIYHDIRYRDEKKVKVNNNQLELSNTPYGSSTLTLNVATGEYVDKYINIGKGKRSIDCSITLTDGSGYDTVNYGATMKVGRKSANNADGQGYPLWGSYTDSDGNRGHFQQIRNDATYGEYILSPKVWGQTYTLLHSADIMPDPSNPDQLALRLTFHNYSSTNTDGSFDLKINWHAL